MVHFLCLSPISFPQPHSACAPGSLAEAPLWPFIMKNDLIIQEHVLAFTFMVFSFLQVHLYSFHCLLAVSSESQLL